MPDRLGAPPAGPVLILTPTGRDGEGATKLLAAEGIKSRVCPTLDGLQSALDETAGLVLVADEALFRANLAGLAEWVGAQPPWSDLPFVVLTQSGIGARRQTAELDLPAKLGNVLILERPLNAMSLVSAVKTALRARQRQRQVRDHLARQVDAAEQAATLLEAKVRERTAALEVAEAERRQIASTLAQSQKMEAVGQLTGGLAHDFNNMLTGIVGSLGLMQTRLHQGQLDQVDRFIGLAQQSAERAAGLTHRLLAFSRRQALDAKPTGINQLVTGMTELMRSTLGREITIDTALADGLWTTLCDPNQLENALLNLCINARDAMPEGGRLLIETGNAHLTPAVAAAMRESKPGDYVTLSVTDTGSGMPEEVIARAFDPFFTTKPLGEGTGLGLSMIYGFVQQSGGNVQIRSTVGEGTTVRMFLPRFDGEKEATDRGRADGRAVPNGGHETILVVDDEHVVRMLMTETLNDLGYKFLQAADGAAGLQVVRSASRIDLLVTDVGMPGGMNGRQLADAARLERPGLKVLFITGYAETALSKDGSLEPGMQVMAKPFTMASLANRIREMIAGA